MVGISFRISSEIIFAPAQAELSLRGEGEAGEHASRQLFAGLPLTAAEPLIEPTLSEPTRPAPAPAPTASIDPRAYDAMRSELNGLRELLEVQHRTNRLLQSIIYGGVGFVLGLLAMQLFVRMRIF